MMADYENISELYMRYKRLQKIFFNEILSSIVTENGKGDDDDFCGLFLPVQEGLTLSYFLGDRQEKSVLEVAYLCLDEGVVSVTARNKSERITFIDGMFDLNAFFQDSVFGAPAIIDLKDLCAIADALMSKYWGSRGSIYHDYIDLHRDIYKSIVHYFSTSQDAYYFTGRQKRVLLQSGKVQVCVDRGVVVNLDKVEMDGENVIITCYPERSGYSYFLLILTPDMQKPCIVKYYQTDGNGNTTDDAIFKTTDLLRILRATALYSRDGMWPGITSLRGRDDAKDLLGDISNEDNGVLCKELAELIAKHSSEKTSICERKGISIRHDGQIIGYWDRTNGIMSYSFSAIIVYGNGDICFYDDFDHGVLFCVDNGFYQNSCFEDDWVNDDSQFVIIPDWQLRKLCDDIRQRFSQPSNKQ